MSWWNKLVECFMSWLRTTKPVVTPSPAPTPDPIPQPDPVIPQASDKLWPAYRCDSYFGHGYPSENDDRLNAMDEARAGGLDCIRCNGVPPPGDELAVHLLHWRSPVDGEFKLGRENWYTQGLDHGITRYQIAVNADCAARWAVLTADYPKDSIQFVTSAGDLVAVRTAVPPRSVVVG